MDPRRPSRPGSGPGLPQTSPSGAAKKPGAAGPTPAPGRRQGPAIAETLDQLQKDIRQLQIDFERFFGGGLPLPPEELRGRIQVQFRNLRNININSAVESFRLNDLEARFNSYNELFNRRLREREEGRRPAAARTALPEQQRFDPREGITFGGRFDPEAVEALYHGLAAGAADGPKFDLDSFEKDLARQVASLREKTGCDQVQFRLAEEDGKVKLKARPVTPRTGS